MEALKDLKELLLEAETTEHYIPSTVAASCTVLVMIPGTSMELTRGMRPCRDSRLYVGFRATTPHRDPGLRVEPPVSDPKALTNTESQDLSTHTVMDETHSFL